jgi:hypothetical protein
MVKNVAYEHKALKQHAGAVSCVLLKTFNCIWIVALWKLLMYLTCFVQFPNFSNLILRWRIKYYFVYIIILSKNEILRLLKSYIWMIMLDWGRPKTGIGFGELWSFIFFLIPFLYVPQDFFPVYFSVIRSQI